MSVLQQLMVLLKVCKNLKDSIIHFHYFSDLLNTAGLDYEQTSSSLTFFDQSTQSVPVTIINDILFEDVETFTGLLSAVGDLPSNVLLEPTVANADIIDNERMFTASEFQQYL